MESTQDFVQLSAGAKVASSTRLDKHATLGFLAFRSHSTEVYGLTSAQVLDMNVVSLVFRRLFVAQGARLIQKPPRTMQTPEDLF